MIYMAYVTFIADGEEVNVYCGYIRGVATSNGIIIPAQSNPTVVYQGEKISDKINLKNVNTLQIKNKNGGTINSNISISTRYMMPKSAKFFVSNNAFVLDSAPITGTPITIKTFSFSNGIYFQYIVSDIDNNAMPLYVNTVQNISNLITNASILTPDLMLFQVNENELISTSPTHFTTLDWITQIRSADESKINGDYPLFCTFGKYKFPKKSDKLKNINVERNFSINGIPLQYDKNYVLYVEGSQRGIPLDYFYIINNPPQNATGYVEYKLISNIMSDNTITEPPETPDNDEGGDGDEDDSTDNIEIPEPPPIFPTNSKLFTLYRLETSQLDQLGGLLWSKNFMDSIFGVNQSPIDAIIDIYALPISNLSGLYGLVKVGNTETQISAQIPSKWTVTINCGNLYLQRYYDDFVDYMAQYQIYLPFIGLRPLSTDLTGSTLNVQYIIDLLTGNCTAMIYDTQGKTGLSSCLYSFNGNCSYSVPYTGQNLRNQAVKRLSGYGGAVSSLIQQDWAGLAKNVVDFGVSEWAQQGQGLFTEDTGGCAGYLNVMTPFIIITRTKKHKNSYTEKLGAMFYSNAVYSDLVGFNQIIDPHLAFNNLTDKENEMINDLLSRGVIF